MLGRRGCNMKFKSLVLIAVLSLFALGIVLSSAASADGLPTFIHLYQWEKAKSGWYMGKIFGMLEYYPAGPKFKFYFYAHDKIPGVSYKLIACPWFAPVGTSTSCVNPVCIKGGKTDDTGLLSINGVRGVELNSNLDNAMMVLVRPADVDCTAHTIKTWKPRRLINAILALCSDDPTPPCCPSQDDLDAGRCIVTTEDGYMFGYTPVDYTDTNLP
jgi:hypothetical protein